MKEGFLFELPNYSETLYLRHRMELERWQMEPRITGGKSIYLKGDERELVKTALERYQSELMDKYNFEETRKEYQIEIAIRIRNILDDKIL